MTVPRLADGVSVIVPAFNAAAHVADAIASALMPSPVPVEVIVADDASTDATCAVVEEIARTDPRVRLLRMRANGGPSRARNAAAADARYGWLALLDADDRWRSGRLERLAGVAERTGAQVVSDNIEVHGLRGERWDLNRAFGWAPVLDDPLDALQFSRHGWAVKPAFVRYVFEESGGFNERVAYGEDALLFTQWLLRGARWTVHPVIGYEYARRKGSLTGGDGEPRQLVGVLEMLRREASDLGRGDVALALASRLRRSRADAAFADVTRAVRTENWRTCAHAAVALAPHLSELCARAYDGVVRRMRLRQPS